MMYDFLGYEIKAGDCVVFTEFPGDGLIKGTILRFDRGIGMAIVEYYDHSRGCLQKTKKTSAYLLKVKS